MSRNCLGHVEPLHAMRAYRQRTKPFVDNGTGWRGSTIYQSEQRMYFAARRRAMQPVALPRDIPNRVHPIFQTMFQQLGLAA